MSRARWDRLAAPLIALLAIASSANGIRNQFTYDDRYIIQLNTAMRSLHGWWRVFESSYWPKNWGGDGYRPLTILAFKIEWALGGGSPAFFHGVNILLYAISAVLVFALGRRILPVWAAAVSAALFAVHPVHVEAVANVVGQAELVVAVTLLFAVLLYVRARERGGLRPTTFVGIVLLYAIACFSKEHGIVLPALLVAAELTVTDDGSPLRSRARAMLPMLASLAAVGIAFVVARSRVLAGHGLGGFEPFTPFSTLHISARDRVLTAIGVVPQWARLLFWPAHLSSEYGPPELPIAQGLNLLQLPGFLVLTTVIGVGVAVRRRQPVVAFGIAIVCITLLPSSNFLLPAGILLAERTLFLPSVGAMLIVGASAVYAAGAVAGRLSATRAISACAAAAYAAVLATGVLRSVTRTRVWRDNDTLFRQAVVDSPRAYRAHYMLGTWAFENKRLREGEHELQRAISLFPYDPFLSYNMAEQYRVAGRCAAAVPMYRWTLSLDKNFPLGHTALAACLLESGNYEEARTAAIDAFRFGGDSVTLRRVIAVSDSLIAAGAKQSDLPWIRPAWSPGKLPDSVQKAGRGRGNGAGG